MEIAVQRREPLVEEQANLLEHPLSQKIQYLRSNWQQEGLPQNWYEMPGTGFWIEPQMAQLPENWTTGDLSSWLTQKVKPDVQGFTLEYLAKKGVFPIQYDIHRQADGAYLTAPMYGGAKLLNVIDPKERHGALVDAIQQVTIFFADEDTPDGALAVITSVKGPSNIFDPHSGKEIIFPDSQRYLLQKQGDSMIGFTIRTDASLFEERAFIKALTGRDIPDYAEPEEYVRTVACITPAEGSPKTFADVVRVMEDIHQRPLAFESKKEGVAIPWSEIYTDINRTDLWDFPAETGELFDQFETFALEVSKFAGDTEARCYARQLLQEGLVATILDISRYVEGAKQQACSRRASAIGELDNKSLIHSDNVPVHMPSYGSAMKTIKAAGGCSKTREESDGGLSALNNSVNQLIKSLSPRFGEEEEGSGCSCGENHDNHYHCPQCDRKFGDETSRAADERTKACSCGFEFGC